MTSEPAFFEALTEQERQFYRKSVAIVDAQGRATIDEYYGVLALLRSHGHALVDDRTLRQCRDDKTGGNYYELDTIKGVCLGPLDDADEIGFAAFQIYNELENKKLPWLEIDNKLLKKATDITDKGTHRSDECAIRIRDNDALQEYIRTLKPEDLRQAKLTHAMFKMIKDPLAPSLIAALQAYGVTLEGNREKQDVATAIGQLENCFTAMREYLQTENMEQIIEDPYSTTQRSVGETLSGISVAVMGTIKNLVLEAAHSDEAMEVAEGSIIMKALRHDVEDRAINLDYSNIEQFFTGLSDICSTTKKLVPHELPVGSVDVTRLDLCAAERSPRVAAVCSIREQALEGSMGRLVEDNLEQAIASAEVPATTIAETNACLRALLKPPIEGPSPG